MRYSTSFSRIPSVSRSSRERNCSNSSKNGACSGSTTGLVGCAVGVLTCCCRGCSMGTLRSALSNSTISRVMSGCDWYVGCSTGGWAACCCASAARRSSGVKGSFGGACAWGRGRSTTRRPSASLAVSGTALGLTERSSSRWKKLRIFSMIVENTIFPPRLFFRRAVYIVS